MLPVAFLRRLARATILLLVVPAAVSARQSERDQAVEELRSRIEQLRTTDSLIAGGAVIRTDPLLLAAYETRGFRPLWERHDAVASLIRGIADVAADGLDPEDYHLPALRRAAESLGGPADAAELDLLCTDALLRIGHDLRYGKAPPQGPTSEPRSGWAAGDPEAVDALADLVTSGRVEASLAELRPRHFVYAGLKKALADLRWIEAGGGWEPIAAGPLMGRDSVDDRVPALRTRLALEGDYTGPAGDTSRVYDAYLEAAVRSFQHRHGLNEDGLVERATLAALAVPVEERIAQLRVNLERARWVGHELPADELVVVNVAGARVYMLRGDSVVFETRAIVGTEATRTPVFAAEMRYVVLNPTWTVPSSALDEVLDLARADADYLGRQGMHLLDASGKEVDAGSVDLTRYTAADFPYTVRQDPGPMNALGRIKLMLPNSYHVYLHDTPSRSLFARETRLFSHGCIRLQDPVGLAELVLGDHASWSRAALEQAIASGETRTIPLARPVPVFVLYWTAGADAYGVSHFYPDVYGRDAAVLAALDGDVDRGTPGGDPR
ncbi:MAG: murein L,D-transpeptidase [Gemmatimonadales bacterium]